MKTKNTEALEFIQSYKLLLNNMELVMPKNEDGSVTIPPWLRDCRKHLAYEKAIREALTAKEVDVEGLKKAVKCFRYPDGHGGVPDEEYLNQHKSDETLIDHLSQQGYLSQGIPPEEIEQVYGALEIGLKIRNDVHPNDCAPLYKALELLQPYRGK